MAKGRRKSKTKMTDQTITKRALIRFGRTLLFSVVSIGLVQVVDLIPQLQLDGTISTLLIAVITAALAGWDKLRRDSEII